MPVLPSGRRVEFSLDRFNALLSRMPVSQAKKTVDALRDADDLLHVMDLVEFSAHGKAFFSGHIAANFETYAIHWSRSDQDALAAWINSGAARYHRADAIAEIAHMVAEVDAPWLSRLLQAA